MAVKKRWRKVIYNQQNIAELEHRKQSERIYWLEAQFAAWVKGSGRSNLYYFIYILALKLRLYQKLTGGFQRFCPIPLAGYLSRLCTSLDFDLQYMTDEFYNFSIFVIKFELWIIFNNEMFTIAFATEITTFFLSFRKNKKS